MIVHIAYYTATLHTAHRQVALCNQEVNAMHKKHTVEMRGMERWVVEGRGGREGWGGECGQQKELTQMGLQLVHLHGPDLLHFRVAAGLILCT